MRSAEPPALNGTTMVIGSLGQASSATAAPLPNIRPAAAKAVVKKAMYRRREAPVRLSILSSQILHGLDRPDEINVASPIVRSI